METIRLIFDLDGEDADEFVRVSSAGSNLFRVEDHPDFLIWLIQYGDVMEVSPCEDGFRFVRIAEPSPFKLFEFTIGMDTVQSNPMQRVLKKLKGRGGYWVALINFLYIYVPNTDDYDPTAEVELIQRNTSPLARAQSNWRRRELEIDPEAG